MSSPTSKTLNLLRKEGWQCQVVEKYNAHSHTRLDLFGIIDVLAVRSPEQSSQWFGKILGVQTTSASNVSARIKKALAEPKLVIWLSAGGLFEIHGWNKKGKKGQRKTYQVTKRNFCLSQGNKGSIVEILQ